MELTKKDFIAIKETIEKIENIENKLKSINDIGHSIVTTENIIEFNLDILDISKEQTEKTENKPKYKYNNSSNSLSFIVDYYPTIEEMEEWTEYANEPNNKSKKSSYITQKVNDSLALRMLSLLSKELIKEKTMLLKKLNKTYNVTINE